MLYGGELRDLSRSAEALEYREAGESQHNLLFWNILLMAGLSYINWA